MRHPSRARTSSSSPPQPAPKRTSSTNPANLARRASAPASLPSAQSVDNGLAICLFGVATKTRMYDAEFEEDRRRRVVMAEVLPDAEMWRKWEKNEAPLRQGRGWYPALDRHFLELLVISEIAALSNPLNAGGSPGTAERVHRHAVRVRRVACERIGQERLGAYCDRVKEAFEAYVSAPPRHAGWGMPQAPRQPEEDDDEEEEERGRRLVREGSRERETEESRGPDRAVGSWGDGGEGVGEVSMGSASDSSGGSESDDEASIKAEEGDNVEDPFSEAFMEIDILDPLILASSGPEIVIHEATPEPEEALPALSPSRSDSDSESIAGSVWGGGEVVGGVRIELDDVDERDESEGSDVDMEGQKEKKGGGGARGAEKVVGAAGGWM